MNKKIVWGVAVIIVIIGGYYWYTASKKAPSGQATQQTVQTDNFGTYAYECDEHVKFTMTPASDMSTITLAAAEGGVYPPAVTLAKVESSSGVRFEGGGFTFFGKGESVTLTEAGQSLNCSPVPSQDEAPFNFGD